MRNFWKWSVCTLATTALLFTWSTVRAAQDAAAKGKIAGVVMKEGKAVAGVEVRLMKPPGGAQRPPQGPQQQAQTPGENPPPGGPGGNRPAPIATATTDADGKFVIENVAPGDYGINAGSREAGMGRARVHVEAGKTAEVKIELRNRPQGGPGGGPGGGQRPPAPPQN